METKCLYHFFRAPDGNCKICIPDVRNWLCKGYWPIHVGTFTAKEEDHEKEKEAKSSSNS